MMFQCQKNRKNRTYSDLKPTVMSHSHSALEGGCGLAALCHLILGQLLFVNSVDRILEKRSIF